MTRRDRLVEGAEYVDSTGCEHLARADVVVLAANGIGTPRLLRLSASNAFPDGLANSSGLVGRRLMMHPFAVVTGVFERFLGDVARQRRLEDPLPRVLRDAMG